MRTLYIEVLATYDGPEPWKAPDNRHGEGNGRVLRRRSSESRRPRPCVGDPRGRSEALDTGCAQAGLFSPKWGLWGADAVMARGRQYRWRRFREPSVDPAGSKIPCMCVISSC